MNGWIAVNRAVLKHPIFKKRPDRTLIWIWMLAKAAWKDTPQDANGKTIIVRRGQILTSLRQMEEATGVGVQVIRTLLDRLKTEHSIKTVTNTGRLLITICNYDIYQAALKPPNTAPNTAPNTGPTQDQHTKEQENNILEDANASSLSAETDDFKKPEALDDVAEAVSLYQEYAARNGWPKILKISKPRRSKLVARLKAWDGIIGWRAAMERAQASPHCCGDNERGWVANFDFFLQDSSLTKLMEGAYDCRTKPNRTLNGGQHDRQPSKQEVCFYHRSRGRIVNG